MRLNLPPDPKKVGSDLHIEEYEKGISCGLPGSRTPKMIGESNDPFGYEARTSFMRIEEAEATDDRLARKYERSDGLT